MFFPYQQKQNVFHYLVLDNKKAVYSFTERVVWALKLIWRIEKKKYEMYVWPEWIEAKSYVFFFLVVVVEIWYRQLLVTRNLYFEKKLSWGI